MEGGEPATTHPTTPDGAASLVLASTQVAYSQPQLYDDSAPTQAGEDTASIYWSVRSRLSVSRLSLLSIRNSSIFTISSGRPSQDGATWDQALTKTMNSGFASGAPRSAGYKGVREGREKGGFLPRIKGIGRTGKGPAPVPQSMLKALGVKSATAGLQTLYETIVRDTKKEEVPIESEAELRTKKAIAQIRENQQRNNLIGRRIDLEGEVDNRCTLFLETWGIEPQEGELILPTDMDDFDSFASELSGLLDYLDEREQFAERTLGPQEVDVYESPELSREMDELNLIISTAFFRHYRGRLKGLQRQMNATLRFRQYQDTQRTLAAREIQLRKRLVELTQIAEKTAEGQIALTKCRSSIRMALRAPGCDCDECFSMVWPELTVLNQQGQSHAFNRFEWDPEWLHQDYAKSYDGRWEAVEELVMALSRLAGPQTSI